MSERLSLDARCAGVSASVGLDECDEQPSDSVRQFVVSVFPDLERDAHPEPFDEIKLDWRARISRLEFRDDGVEAGDDPELSEQPVSLVMVDLDDVRRDFDPNRIGSTCFHDDSASGREAIDAAHELLAHVVVGRVADSRDRVLGIHGGVERFVYSDNSIDASGAEHDLLADLGRTVECPLDRLGRSETKLEPRHALEFTK